MQRSSAPVPLRDQPELPRTWWINTSLPLSQQEACKVPTPPQGPPVVPSRLKLYHSPWVAPSYPSYFPSPLPFSWDDLPTHYFHLNP